MKNGFALIEVMIVVVITGILFAIAIPSFMKVKKDAEAKKQMEIGLSFGNVVAPKIPNKSPLSIMAAGATDVFTVYKVYDQDANKTFYIVVGSNTNQTIALEKIE